MNMVTLPRFPVAGGCQCRKIRYSLRKAPSVVYICHCTECQKQSSSAFGQSMRVRAEDVEIIGVMARFSRKTANGTDLDCDYCPACGTRLFHRRAVYQAEINIKAGSLDDTSWLKPAGHIWTRSKQVWVDISTQEISFEGQPPNYESMKSKWNQMIGVSE
jgi:hypothetical protein